jgi:acyl-CoA dehydrogenase
MGGTNKGCTCQNSLLLSRMVIDHRVSANDPFRLTENSVQRAITDHLLGERAVGMAEVGELLGAA